MRRALAGLIALISLSIPVHGADESLAAARELYAAAAYDDALTMLNRLRSVAQGADQRVIEQYRAFCLLALGRSADAQQAIEAVVAAEPSFVPANGEVSPRVRTAFSDVRRRMLPGIIQDRYARAKASYDRKEFAAASAAFQEVLTSLSDPDLGASVSGPPLADIRTLATGFHQLSVAAATPPPPPEPVKPPPPPESVVAAEAVAKAPEPPVVKQRNPLQPFSPEDSSVVPPTAVRQRLPEIDLKLANDARVGVLEVIIDRTGKVESATMRTSVHPKYDPLVVDAARAWRFNPATLDGEPVRYRKLVTIAVRP
jgi:TonB family protein